MRELYLASRDAQVTVALISHDKPETLPAYVLGSRPAPETASAAPARVRQTGGMTAEQFDRIFPVWAARYPGRVSVQR